MEGRSLCENRALPEFPAHQILPLAQHYEVNEQLREFLTQRVQTEGDLEDMLSDRAADRLPLDPNRDYENEYRRLSQQYDDLNKAIYTVYATFLDTSNTSYFTQDSTSLAIVTTSALNTNLNLNIYFHKLQS
jgi:hypothetical protein